MPVMCLDCIASCTSLPGTYRLFYLWLKSIFFPAPMTKLVKTWCVTCTVAEMTRDSCPRSSEPCLRWTPRLTLTFGGAAEAV